MRAPSLDPEAQMIRSLLVLRARPGRRAALLRAIETLGVRALVADQHGLLDPEVVTAVDDEDEVVIVGRWASPGLHERWLAGPVPGRLLAEVEGLLSTEPVSRVYHVVESVS
jgi:quinol monooxygenase YgiN